jgi:hypothetical protein
MKIEYMHDVLNHPPSPKELNEYGAEGWILVGAPTKCGTVWQLWFYRQVEEYCGDCGQPTCVGPGHCELIPGGRE